MSKGGLGGENGTDTMINRRIASLILGLTLTGALVSGLVLIRDRTESRKPRSGVGAVVGDPLTPNGVRVSSSSASKANVTFDLNWSGAVFPGVFECTWDALGADGAVVGSYSTEVVSLQPVIADTSIDIDVSAPAVAARADCGSSRLDDGRPYEYSFSDVQAVSTEKGLASVSFLATWRGGGYPGVVKCSVEVLGLNGEVLTAQNFNIHIAPGTSDPTDLRVLAPSLKEVKDARLSNCQPFKS